MLRIGPSLELCGGTHAFRTGDIGLFKVLSEGGLAAGVRRIEAATGLNALAHLRAIEGTLRDVAMLMKTRPSEALHRVEKLIEREKELEREIGRLQKSIASGGSHDLTADAKTIGGVTVLGATVDLGDAAALRELVDQLRDKLAPAVVLLGSATRDGKVLLVCSVSKELTDRHPAGRIVKEAAHVVGGGGGGRPDFAQAGGSDPTKLGDAVRRVYDLVAGN
jgi:alanyl-tRNA synthetase